MSEYNICGVLVMATPQKGSIIEDTLNKIEGVEVHAREDGGKMVVTVEGPLGRQLANIIGDFSNIDGVLSTSLVYHEIDSDSTCDHTPLEHNQSPAEERLQ